MADQVLGAFFSERDRRSGTLSVTLASSGNSDSVDIRGMAQIIIGFPGSMASTNVDVQVSGDNTTFFDLYTRDGTQVTFTTSSSRFYDVPELAGAMFFRLVTDADDSSRAAVIMGKV